MTIHDFIRQQVASAGSQTAVARKTGVSQGTIAKICNGDTTPELPTMLKIIAAYGLMANDIAEMETYKYQTACIATPPLPVSEQLADYSAEVRLIADYLQRKFEGKSADERLLFAENIMEQAREIIK